MILHDSGAPARLTRAQETELPREVSLSYTDIGADYRRSAIVSRRLVGASGRRAHADLAVVTDDASASRQADMWLQDLWAGRESAEFGLPPSRLAISPGDVIGVTINSRRRLFEVAEIVDTEERRIKARSIDPEVFGLPLGQPSRRVPSTPAAIGPVSANALDLPSLNGEEPAILTRLAVFADPWPGPVAIWRSRDGLSFEQAALALAPSIVGVTLDPWPRGPASRWDRASRVRVRLSGGILSSASDDNVLGGANAAAIRNVDGAWEVFQFANAVLVAERTYELSHCLRGQAGSEWAIADVTPAGAPFVLLDNHLATIAAGLDALDRPLQLRIVAADRDHGDAASVALQVTPSATALRPLAPVHLAARRDAGGVVFTWIRRTRRDGDNWAIVEVPIGEAGETYALEILSGANVIRTAQGTATLRLVATTNLFTASRRVAFVSAGTAGASAGPRLQFGHHWRGNAAGLGGFTYRAVAGVGDAAAVANARWFMGMCLIAPIGNVNPSTLLDMIGIGADSGDANLQVMRNDGSGAATKIDLGANFPANTRSIDFYELTLFAAPNGSSIEYIVRRLNTGHEASGSLTTDLPADTTFLAPQIGAITAPPRLRSASTSRCSISKATFKLKSSNRKTGVLR